VEIYGIDNFRLIVPEPAEIVMLSMALAASVAAVRRRKGTSSAAAVS
jgi:hypothetical protein